VTLSFVMCVCPSACPSAWNNLGPTGWIFMEFDVLSFYFWQSAKSVQVSLKSGKNNGYFTWSPTYIIYHILLTSS
jgi:hypothetical protein